MPDVFWLIGAQRRFLESQETTLAVADLRARYEAVSRKLAATFPKAAAVLVRNLLSSYTLRSDQHILLVEAIWRSSPATLVDAAGSPPGNSPEGQAFRIGWPDFVEMELGQQTQTSAHVVKIADDSAIPARELAAWESCRPVGMTHDSVLMRLRPGPLHFDRSAGPASIVYEDAHHVIGAGVVLSLEEAVMSSCLWGTPTVESIEILIKCLYERLGADFYARSHVIQDPAANLAALRNWKGLDKWLEDWWDPITAPAAPSLDRLRARREVLGFLAPRRHCLIDPIDYLRSVVACPEFCPVLLWGCSHGDLHGRNVLVSVLDNDVSLPALFDYQEMGLNNAIGWDFVKLETELKTRALPLILAGPESEFIVGVGEFECYLAESTLAIHDQRGEPREFGTLESARRLARIILMIRKEARRHLGLEQLRDRQWLEEYYFLLACYGVCAGRYEAYQGFRRQIAAAYISAGVAARQLWRPWKQLEVGIREAKTQAELLRDRSNPPAAANQDQEPPPSAAFDPHTYVLDKAKCEMSHHARLAFAKVWLRSGKDTYLQAAVRVLKQLRDEYPHVLEIEEEFALAYLELGQVRDAEALLDEVQLRYGQLSEEMLCRLGRLWKDEGNKTRVKDRIAAAQLFQLGLDWYRRAYEIRRDYYPGINLATLQFVLGQREPARRTAESILKSLESRDVKREELAWIWATQAEADLLLASFPPDYRPDEWCAKAEQLYRQAVADCPIQSRQTMRRQAELIVSYAAAEVQGYWSLVKSNELFG